MCPTRTPPWWPRWAWAASSSTSSPRSIHVAMCAGGTTWPNRCTGMTARVRGGEHRLHRLGREQQRVGIDVGEHGRGAGVDHGLGGGDERHRRHDDLVAVADAERPQRQRQGVGAGADTGGVGHAVGGGERPLEGGQLGPLDERPGAHHPVVGGVELGPDRVRGGGGGRGTGSWRCPSWRVSFLFATSASSTCWSPSTAGRRRGGGGRRRAGASALRSHSSAGARRAAASASARRRSASNSTSSRRAARSSTSPARK